MSDLPSILSSLNPEEKPIVGKSAAGMTKNILSQLDLSQHTANDILSALRNANINITIPSFYQIYNDVTGAKTRSQRIKYVNQQYTPNESVLEPSLYGLPAKYRIVHRITYLDEETGITITREFAVDTNTLSTIGDMQQLAIDIFESKYPYIVEDIATIGGYINSKG